MSQHERTAPAWATALLFSTLCGCTAIARDDSATQQTGGTDNAMVTGERTSATGLAAVLVRGDGGANFVTIADGPDTIFRLASDGGPTALGVVVDGIRSNVAYGGAAFDTAGTLTLTGGAAGPLQLSERLRNLDANTIERTVSITATADASYYLALEYHPTVDASYYSYLGEEPSPATYDQEAGGQPFPLAAVMTGNMVYGAIGDTPAVSGNRSLQQIDPGSGLLAIQNGDDRPPTTIDLDGEELALTHQQPIAAGETQSFTSWMYRDRASGTYDVRLSAHRALGRAKGWARSDLQAIVRTTPYLLRRANLFQWGAGSPWVQTSGIAYGWKEWVSDALLSTLGDGDWTMSQSAYDALYDGRVTYEDNAQYYLLWSLLLSRAGATPDAARMQLAYQFLRAHELDGAFIPPAWGTQPDGEPDLGGKSYMDLFFFAADDSPTSVQGLHCAALLAAEELGLGATDADVDRCAAAYRGMFNTAEGFMPVSREKQKVVASDALMGEVWSYALFGRQLLTDDMVRAHLALIHGLDSTNGLKVFQLADGSFLEPADYSIDGVDNPYLPGATGSYQTGGSWLLCDMLTYLAGTVHGIDTESDQVSRLLRELRDSPSFPEYLNTVTGDRGGSDPYGWASAFLELRRMVRERLQLGVDDPLEHAVDDGLAHRVAD